MKLRIAEIPARGTVTTPQESRLHDDINSALTSAEPLFTQSGLELRRLEATSPHTLGRHDVLWLNEPCETSSIHWDTQSELKTGNSPDFWRSVEQYVRTEQHTHGKNLRGYMYHGFILPEWKNGTTAPVIWHGLQSQVRLHMHLAESLPKDTQNGWIDSTESARNTSLIARFLNLAGEGMLLQYPHTVFGFGERFQYDQHLLGNDETTRQSRTLFAFPDLATAIEQSRELKKSISEYWFIMAQSLAEHSPQMFAGQVFSILQSAVPNFVFIIPSEEDMHELNRAQQEVWVAPFSVVGAPEMLTPGGVHLQRKLR